MCHNGDQKAFILTSIFTLSSPYELNKQTNTHTAYPLTSPSLNSGHSMMFISSRFQICNSLIYQNIINFSDIKKIYVLETFVAAEE